MFLQVEQVMEVESNCLWESPRSSLGDQQRELKETVSKIGGNQVGLQELKEKPCPESGVNCFTCCWQITQVGD